MENDLQLGGSYESSPPCISGRLGVAVLSVLSVCVCVRMCAANIYQLFLTQLQVYREDGISGRWEVAILSVLSVCVHVCVPLTFA